jgi:DNA topoisomerase VI subunit A
MYYLDYDLYSITSYDEETETVYLGSDESKIKFSFEEFSKRFMNVKEETNYIVRMEEVYYWRKAYDIRNLFYSFCNHVENLGYYKVSQKDLEEISLRYDTMKEGIPSIEDPENQAIFYHEWY